MIKKTGKINMDRDQETTARANVPVSPIGEGFDRLDMVISDLIEESGRLDKLLQPILAPESPVGGDSVEEKVPVESPMAQILRDKVIRLRKLLRVLNNISSRVQL